MNHEDTMLAAYIAAMYFTETGEDGQPPANAPLTPLTRMRAWQACRQFRQAVGPYGGARFGAIEGYDELPWDQIGQDLWLTRNGHGTGFWDRQCYTEAQADLFCRLAAAMGTYDPEFLETKS